jgi:hypothetical protein
MLAMSVVGSCASPASTQPSPPAAGKPVGWADVWQARNEQRPEGRSVVKKSPGYEANRARISLALSEFTVPLLSRIYHTFDGDI